MSDLLLRKMVFLLLLIAVPSASCAAYLISGFLGLFLYALPLPFIFFKIFSSLDSVALFFFLFAYPLLLSPFIGSFVALNLALHYFSLLAMKELIPMDGHG